MDRMLMVVGARHCRGRVQGRRTAAVVAEDAARQARLELLAAVGRFP